MTARPRKWAIFCEEQRRGSRRKRTIRLGEFRGNLREAREEVAALDAMTGEGSLFGHALRRKHSALPIRETQR